MEGHCIPSTMKADSGLKDPGEPLPKMLGFQTGAIYCTLEPLALDARLGRLSTHFPVEPNPFSAQLISTRKEVVHFPLRCGQRLLLSKGQRPFGDLITTQPGLCQFLPGDYWTSFATSLG